MIYLFYNVYNYNRMTEHGGDGLVLRRVDHDRLGGGGMVARARAYDEVGRRTAAARNALSMLRLDEPFGVLDAKARMDSRE